MSKKELEKVAKKKGTLKPKVAEVTTRLEEATGPTVKEQIATDELDVTEVKESLKELMKAMTEVVKMLKDMQQKNKAGKF